MSFAFFVSVVSYKGMGHGFDFQLHVKPRRKQSLMSWWMDLFLLLLTGPSTDQVRKLLRSVSFVL